jgi:hypothetical protein
MEREQIIQWAFEADMEGAPADDNCRAPHFNGVIAEELEAFAKKVRDDYSNKHAQLWLKRIDEAVRAEREACAKKVGEFAQKWWSIHCDSNKHMETTRKAHDDFCALQSAIRARGN